MSLQVLEHRSNPKSDQEASETPVVKRIISREKIVGQRYDSDLKVGHGFWTEH